MDALNLPMPTQELWRRGRAYAECSTEIKADTGTEWNRESVKVTVTMTAEAEAAGMRSQYKIGSEGKWTDYTAPILVEAEGETIVYARGHYVGCER